MPPFHFLLQCYTPLLVATHLVPSFGFVIAPKVRLVQDRGSLTKGSIDGSDFFPDAKVETFELLPHRPLGMTIEESLADSRIILVTKVKEGGHASKAGVVVGDVLVGITGIFGEMTHVVGLNVEKIKKLVQSRPESEPLEIKLARGTEAFDAHEKVIVDLCAYGLSDREIEQCVIDYLSLDNQSLNNAPDEECNLEDSDADCLIGNLVNMWAEDLPPPPQTPADNSPVETAKETIKPWSSRSSPSGTFVRDPITGQMKNIG